MMVTRTFPLTTGLEYGGGFLRRSLRIVLLLLIAVCVFDPADKLLGAKVPLFVLGWVLFLIDMLVNDKEFHVPLSMLSYLILFILIIPLISVNFYFLFKGDLATYDGYMYFKPYLFLTIVIILYVSKIDIYKQALTIMSLLSVVTLVMAAISYFNPVLATFLYTEIGIPYGIYSMGVRDYGDYNIPMMYFHTSPLLVFPVGYFTMAALNSNGAKKVRNMFLLAINMVAMFLAASRNNMLASIMIPMFITLWYSKRKIVVFSIIVTILSIITLSNLDLISSMLNPEYESNELKLSFLEEYMTLFSDGKTWLIGQGLGSYFYTAKRGYVSLTELTYFEFIRRFGFLLSVVIYAMLLYPLEKLRFKEYHEAHYLFICYMFYLIMCNFNPLLMSSSGMLLLSIVLYKTFSIKYQTYSVGKSG